ncbi:MAG: cysteine synthase A [Hyphomicrobium zavarzinii]|jgi:cysteine synthase A|uniref:cysteine synthase A n=1 Tax=Hyphomicrobium TaxID=81 RepID=UPI000381E18E|nr:MULTISPECIES: cysteine synthase A [Hyphomicrobium]MBL8845569.1 cysteine synthase A [Hyphomicrobium zavarzinii]WBT38906.1 cysteine synthase A [Hyphomicrobium sp. DMF-1]HML42439.1 cysteine synthase A [Hyphomicrobium zavarzinii]
MTDATEIKTLKATQSWGRGRVFSDITETIGHTPLVRLQRVAKQAGAKADVLVKLEFFNPLSSVKDRIGVAMIDVLEAEGKITPGKSVLVEPTSGNTGIGLAFVCAARGYKLILVMPESMSIERRKILTHLGAELVLTPAAGGMPGAIDKANQILAETPGAVQPSQFENPANPLVHEKTTAEEIWTDTQGNVDAIVIGVGTGGTLTGCGRVLKARKPSLKVIAVEPEGSPILSGGARGPHKIQGIGAGFVPKVLDTKFIDEVVRVSNEKAFETSRSLAKLEGIPGGISTGANVAAALEVAARDEMRGKTVVTFAPSSAERYFSSELFVEPPQKV